MELDSLFDRASFSSIRKASALWHAQQHKMEITAIHVRITKRKMYRVKLCCGQTA